MSLNYSADPSRSRPSPMIRSRLFPSRVARGISLIASFAAPAAWRCSANGGASQILSSQSSEAWAARAMCGGRVW